MSPPRSPWPKAGVALAAVALMPLLHLWAIDQLDRTHRALHRMSPTTLALSFDDPVTPIGSPKRSTQAGTVASKAPLPTVETPNVPPAKPTAHDAAAVEMLTTPLSYRNSLEMMVSSAGTLLLTGLALAMIFSIARSGPRDTTTAAGGTLGEPVRVLTGLAEQTRRDAREAVHAMRTPIAIIIGYSDMLKRSVPPDNAKAWRAIEAINVSTVRLNDIVDEAWARALAVANLMQSERELVVLREVAASIAGTSSARFVICDAGIETSVHGPRAAIEETVRAVIETFAAQGPGGTPTIRFAAGDGTIGLEIRRAEADPKATAIDDLGLNRWPRLYEAARTARLLGGSMAVRATEDRLQQAIVELPTAPRSG
jgi:signal transduction histidine kinase